MSDVPVDMLLRTVERMERNIREDVRVITKDIRGDLRELNEKLESVGTRLALVERGQIECPARSAELERMRTDATGRWKVKPSIPPEARLSRGQIVAAALTAIGVVIAAVAAAIL